MRLLKTRLSNLTQPWPLAGMVLLYAASWGAHADDCAPVKIDTWIKASFALSGDTLIIQNRPFRLIGVQAPQIKKERKFTTPGQPLADESQTKLNQLLANHNLEVGVEYDELRIDDFSRNLAHFYIKQNNQIVSLQKLMLESGLVLANSEPPNMKHQTCYYQAEKSARDRKIALWSVAEKRPDLHYPIAPSSKITTEDEGFRIFKGEIVKVEKSGSNYILNMDTTGIRVRKADWEHFNYDALKRLQGQVIEARGYGFLYGGAMFVKIRSPNAIDRLNPVNE